MSKSQTRERQPYAQLIRGALDDTGKARTVSLSFDLDDHGDEVIDALRQITRRTSPVSAYRLRISSRVADGEAGAVILDGLASSSPATRRVSAQACGLLRFDAAVPALGALLVDPERRARRAAAEALGRIGGHRAADHLLRALRSRNLAPGWLLLSLVRAAPDRYLEARLAGAPDARLVPWLALAAGMQRRQSVRPRLLDLCASPDARTRAHAARALGWIGDTADVPPLRVLVHAEQDPRVREAAARALRRLHDPMAAAVLDSLSVVASDGASTQSKVARPSAASASTPPPVEAVTSEPPSSVVAFPEYRPAPPAAPPLPAEPVPPAVPRLAVVQDATPAAAAPPANPPSPASPQSRPPGQGLVLRAMRRLVRDRPRSPRLEPPPLTPAEVATTPHHYTPAPALLDEDLDEMAEET